jgi:preprotein translocase subunit SecE
MEAIENMKSWPTAIKDYYNELKLEMRRVTWPNRRQVEGTTLVVILTVFGFAAFFAVVDAVLQDSVVRIFNVLSKT